MQPLGSNYSDNSQVYTTCYSNYFSALNLKSIKKSETVLKSLYNQTASKALWYPQSKNGNCSEIFIATETVPKLFRRPQVKKCQLFWKCSKTLTWTNPVPILFRYSPNTKKDNCSEINYYLNDPVYIMVELKL